MKGDCLSLQRAVALGIDDRGASLRYSTRSRALVHELIWQSAHTRWMGDDSAVAHEEIEEPPKSATSIVEDLSLAEARPTHRGAALHSVRSSARGMAGDIGRAATKQSCARALATVHGPVERRQRDPQRPRLVVAYCATGT
jgi:hypothetical protein